MLNDLIAVLKHRHSLCNLRFLIMNTLQSSLNGGLLNKNVQVYEMIIVKFQFQTHET
jgi:hypothetical protein